MSAGLTAAPPRVAGSPTGPPRTLDLDAIERLTEAEAVALLHDGARFTQPLFHAVRDRTPPGFKAELIEGIVHVAGPLARPHGLSHLGFGTLLGLHETGTPGVGPADDTSVVLTGTAENQPDLHPRVRHDHGGRSRMSSTDGRRRVGSGDDGNHLTTGPAFVSEIPCSTVRVGRDPKRRNFAAGGVREYVVAHAETRVLHGWAFTADAEEEITVPDDGVLRSRATPGLWPNGPAIFGRRGREARRTLQVGLAAHGADAAADAGG